MLYGSAPGSERGDSISKTHAAIKSMITVDDKAKVEIAFNELQQQLSVERQNKDQL